MDPASVAQLAFGLGARVTALFALTAVALLALRRASAATRHLVAVAGLAGALAIPLLAAALPEWELAVLPAVHQTKALAADEPWAAGDRASAPAAPSRAALVPLPGPRFVERAVGLGQQLMLWWTGAAWGLIALFLLARLAAGLGRFARLASGAAETTDLGWLTDLGRASAALRIHRLVRLMKSDRVQVPMTAGLLEPVVLLPEGASRWSAERRRMVLLHELAHVKRLDWLSLLVSEIAASIWWFHPLAWVALRAARQEAEKAADDLVVRAGERPSVYARHLVEIARSLRSPLGAVTAMPMAGGGNLESRLRSLLGARGRKPSSAAGRVASIGLAAAALALAMVRPVRAEEPVVLASADTECAADAASAQDQARVERDRARAERERLRADRDRRRAERDGMRGEQDRQQAERDGMRGEEDRKQAERDRMQAERDRMQADRDRVQAELDRAQAERDRALERAQRELKRAQERMAADAPKLELDGAMLKDKLKHLGKTLAALGKQKGWLENGGHGDWYSRGMELHRSEQYREAIEAFKKSIDEGQRVDAATYNIACGYARLGDNDQAFAWLHRAIDEGFDVSGMLRSDDDLDGLRHDARFRELRKEKGPDAQARRLGEKLDRMISAGARSPDQLDALGKELLRARDYDRAARAFEEAAQHKNSPGSSLYNAACALSLKGDKGAALDMLERSIDGGFSNTGLMKTDDDLDEIRDEPRFQALLQSAQELDMPSVGIGAPRWPWKKGGFKEAWQEAAGKYESYARAHPKSGRAEFELGMARLQTGQLEESARAFQRALELGYRKATTLYNLACVEARRDRKDAAFRYLDQAIEAGFDQAGTLRGDDDLDNLRGDPRYPAAIHKADRRGKEQEQVD